MTLVRAGERAFEVEGVVFDKDGTLVDLDAYWGRAARRWIEMASGGESRLAEVLRRELGYDDARGALLRDGPFSRSTLQDLADLTVRLLVSWGVPSSDAQARAEAARRAAIAVAGEAPVVPIGDVAGTLSRLREAGLRLAVATADDHEAAERGLAALGVRGLIDLVVGGDDDAPPKTDPRLLRWVAARLGTSPSRLLVVGDAELDRRMATEAAGFVAVATGGALHPEADAVVGSIDELGIEGGQPTGRDRAV